MNKFDSYRKALSQYLNSNNIFFHWKGRVSLYFILKAMGLSEGDEVILPAYTCVVVPNTIIYLGLKPVYVDINQYDYNMDVSKIENNITNKTKVIITQNTYGLSSNVEQIVNLGKKYNIFTIEDCTHGFGGLYNGKPNGTYCDAAFYSTQWNKPFSTGVGGFALINNHSLLEYVKDAEQAFYEPTVKDKAMLWALYRAKKYFINEKTYWPLVRIYRSLSKKNLVLGSSSGEEIESIRMPKNYCKKLSRLQANEGLRNLRSLNNILKLRLENAQIYTNFLKRCGKIYVKQSLFSNHSFLRYPLLVQDRQKFLKMAEEKKINIGDWFNSPLHPVQKNLSPWQFDFKKYPVSVHVSKHIVNLPTDIIDIKKVLKFIESNCEQIV